MKFRTKFEVVQQNSFWRSIIANHSTELDFSTVNWVADSEEIRQVYSAAILSSTATIFIYLFIFLFIYYTDKLNINILQTN